MECKNEFLLIQFLTLIDQPSMIWELFHLVELEQNLNITADIYTEDRYEQQKVLVILFVKKQFNKNVTNELTLDE